MKTLSSGIQVDSDTYYKLLEWKDNNMHKFIWWCNEYNVGMSINRLTLENYNALLQYANLD